MAANETKLFKEAPDLSGISEDDRAAVDAVITTVVGAAVRGSFFRDVKVGTAAIREFPGRDHHYVVTIPMHPMVPHAVFASAGTCDKKRVVDYWVQNVDEEGLCVCVKIKSTQSADWVPPLPPRREKTKKEKEAEDFEAFQAWRARKEKGETATDRRYKERRRSREWDSE